MLDDEPGGPGGGGIGWLPPRLLSTFTDNGLEMKPDERLQSCRTSTKEAAQEESRAHFQSKPPL